MGASQGKYVSYRFLILIVMNCLQGPLYKDVIRKIVVRETAQTRKHLMSEGDEEALIGRSSATSNCEDIKDFPYMKEPTEGYRKKDGSWVPPSEGGRLRKQDWQSIIQKTDGYQYNDPTFPHGP